MRYCKIYELSKKGCWSCRHCTCPRNIKKDIFGDYEIEVNFLGKEYYCTKRSSYGGSNVKAYEDHFCFDYERAPDVQNLINMIENEKRLKKEQEEQKRILFQQQKDIEKQQAEIAKQQKELERRKFNEELEQSQREREHEEELRKQREKIEEQEREEEFERYCYESEQRKQEAIAWCNTLDNDSKIQLARLLDRKRENNNRIHELNSLKSNNNAKLNSVRKDIDKAKKEHIKTVENVKEDKTKLLKEQSIKDIAIILIVMFFAVGLAVTVPCAICLSRYNLFSSIDDSELALQYAQTSLTLFIVILIVGILIYLGIVFFVLLRNSNHIKKNDIYRDEIKNENEKIDEENKKIKMQNIQIDQENTVLEENYQAEREKIDKANAVLQSEIDELYEKNKEIDKTFKQLGCIDSFIEFSDEFVFE